MGSLSFSGGNKGLQIGENQGSITANFYPSERPETPPSPLSTVPFRRDEDLVRRDKLLLQMREKSSAPGSRIALVGLGGVGKSQLAIEYSYRIRTESPETWVLWIHASNEARFEQSLRDIADRLKIPGRLDPKASIFRLVEDWLHDEKKGTWICILDNADDYEFLCSPPAAGEGAPTKPLLEYLPRTRNGSLIITTRSREAALKMVAHKNLIEVNPLEEEEALELLQKRLEQPEDEDGLRLVKELEFMPLAIVQAASYIRNRAPRCSVSQYLRDLQASDREATKLLQRETDDCLDRDWEAKNSILLTWQISFNYIRRKNASAAELLSLMSFFDRQGIAEDLIRPHFETRQISTDEESEDTSDSDTSPDFEDNVRVLRSFSFISLSETGSLFTMHRLVQLTTRAWLKSNKHIDQWRETFISILSRDFPNGGYENWEKCRSLFPHVQSAMSQRPKSETSLLQWAELLYRGAQYAMESGNIAYAMNMALESRRQREQLLPGDKSDSEELLASTEILAQIYTHKGHWGEAEKLLLQVVEARKTKSGMDNPNTLTSMSNLASILWNQGLWKEAEEIQLQVMEADKKTPGVGHSNTLISMGNLALTYTNQGQWKKAEEIQLQVMEAQKTKLGVDHPDTLISMNNLAATYMDQGQWEKAEKIQLQVMETRKAKLGVDHPSTLLSMNNLASTYTDQGQCEKAKKIQLQVMEIRKAKLGVDHPSTLVSMNNLASTYTDLGQLEEAEKIQLQAIEAYKTKLGVDHPDTLISMNNLAFIFLKQDRLDEAEKLNSQVLEIRKIKLGVDHPDTLTSMGNLVFIVLKQGRLDEAEQLNSQVLEIQKTKLGVEHPRTLISISNLASRYVDQGQLEKAEEIQVQVLEAYKMKPGRVDHSDTLSAMSNLAYTWKALGRTTDAIELLRTCTSKREQILGPNHPHTLGSSKRLLQWEMEALNVNS